MYRFIEQEESDVTLIGVGAEMAFAVDARNNLMEGGVRAWIVNFPCSRLFDMQTQACKESVMQYQSRGRLLDKGGHQATPRSEMSKDTPWEQERTQGYPRETENSRVKKLY